MQNIKRVQLLAPLTCNAEANVCSDNLHKIVELFWKCLMMVHLTPSSVTVTAVDRNTMNFYRGFMGSDLSNVSLGT